jgi:hypothetical protein
MPGLIAAEYSRLQQIHLSNKNTADLLSNQITAGPLEAVIKVPAKLQLDQPLLHSCYPAV